MISKLKWLAYWTGWLLFYVAVVMLIGGVVGMLVSPIIAWVFRFDMTWSDLLAKSFSMGARYAGVWAGGIALVLCFRRGRHRWLARQSQLSPESGGQQS